jgi:uroporphyrinogen-III decarboxylase
MTSLERGCRVCRRQPVDRVPVGPFTGSRAADFFGGNFRRNVTDVQAIADAQLARQRATGQEIVVTAADAYYLAQSFGLEVALYDEELPLAKGPLLAELDDDDRRHVPDPYCDGWRLHPRPRLLRAARHTGGESAGHGGSSRSRGSPEIRNL